MGKNKNNELLDIIEMMKNFSTLAIVGMNAFLTSAATLEQATEHTTLAQTE